jgi:hypothetical protein
MRPYLRVILPESRYPLFGIMRLAILDAGAAARRRGDAVGVTGPALYAKAPDDAEALLTGTL